MRKRSIAALSALLFSGTTFPAAFQLYELGTPIVGTADVGQAAVASDASTAYFNPAGMIELPTSEFMLGTQTILPYTKFDINNQNTIRGNNGGEAGVLTPGMALYYVYSYSPKLKLGVSFVSPYGGLLNYADGWVGRYMVQDTQFYTLNLNPSVAYKVNKWLGIGGGFSVEYANLYQTVALPTSFIDPVIGGVLDGQANIKATNTHTGFNLGVIITPYPKTKIGIAYRSQIVHNFKGTTTFLRILTTPATTTQMTMPQNVIVSIDQKITNKLNLLGEFGWSNWSAMKKSTVTIDSLTATTVLDWTDTYRGGLGIQYQLKPNWKLQAGASYDSSPTNADKRTPDLPMDRQIRAGAGFIYTMKDIIQIAASYEYINFGDADIHNVSSNGVLSGSYSKNWANVLQVSVNAMV